MTARKKAATPVVAEQGTTISTTDPALDLTTLDRARTYFTRESALAACESDEAAADYATSARVAMIAAEREGVRASVYAAMAAWVAVKRGTLADGERSTSAASTVRTMKEYGEAWVTPKNPDGVKRNTVQMWIRAGEAFIDWSVDPDSPEGKRVLGGLAQAALYTEERKAIRAAVAELSEAQDVTPDQVAEVATTRIARVMEEQAEKEATAKAAREAEKAATKAGTPEVVATRTADGKSDPTKPLDRVKAALAGLSKEDAHAVLAEAAAWLDSDEAATPAA